MQLLPYWQIFLFYPIQSWIILFEILMFRIFYDFHKILSWIALEPVYVLLAFPWIKSSISYPTCTSLCPWHNPWVVQSPLILIVIFNMELGDCLNFTQISNGQSIQIMLHQLAPLLKNYGRVKLSHELWIRGAKNREGTYVKQPETLQSS